MKKLLLLTLILLSFSIFSQEKTTAQINKTNVENNHVFTFPANLDYPNQEIEKLLSRIKRENPEILELTLDTSKTVSLTTSSQVDSHTLFNKIYKRFNYTHFEFHSL